MPFVSALYADSKCYLYVARLRLYLTVPAGGCECFLRSTVRATTVDNLIALVVGLGSLFATASYSRVVGMAWKGGMADNLSK